MDRRKIIVIVIAIVCVLAVGYGIYFQIFGRVNNEVEHNEVHNDEEVGTVREIEDLFDNKVNYQGYSINDENKIDRTKDIVYTDYTLNQIYEGKYTITAEIPVININSENAVNINKQINTIFRDKLNSIIAQSGNDNATVSIYTVEYTAYINGNILSLVIKSTLKEGSNAQRLIIQSYTYNLSTNEQISLANMLELKGKKQAEVEREIKRVVQEGVSRTEALSILGYNIYERNINSDMYKIENSNNYFLGPDETVYIIYAYGNSNYTSENDIVIIK